MKLPGTIGNKLKQLKFQVPAILITIITILLFIAMISMVIKVVIVAGLLILLYDRFVRYKNKEKSRFWGRK